VTLEGKVGVVTGGGSGIGEAICLRLAAEGAKVAVLDVNEDAAALTATLVAGIAVGADVSDSASVDRALEQVEAKLGPVDVWVNNAGIKGGDQAARIAERAERNEALDAVVRLTDDEWRRMLAVHLDGTFYGTRAAARSMAPRGSGAIVNIASVCGIEGCTGFPHYSAAKAGILGFTRAVAKELAVQGVRVNAIAPGFIDTVTSEAVDSPLRQAQRERSPLRRFGRPEEIAATVAFLASEDATFFVGETLSPNGGIVTV
jgi:3-oxoacyl-[acyl-carrier protein] reductase